MRLFATIIFAGLLSAPFLAAEPSCSLATLRGTYGFANNGTAVSNQALYFFAAAGRVKGDGAGNLSAKDTSSTNGQVQRRVYTGTYTLASDCTGSIVFKYPDGSQANVDIVASPDGVNIYFIQTDAGTVISGSAVRQSLPDTAP